MKCGQAKPLADYYKHKSMADGHLNKCKECTKRDVLKYRAENIEACRAYDRDRAIRPDRAANTARVVGDYRARNRDRVAANNAVARAVRSGALVKPVACWHCGSERGVGGHHASYHPTMRLAVSWLCQACHKAVHEVTDQLVAA